MITYISNFKSHIHYWYYKTQHERKSNQCISNKITHKMKYKSRYCNYEIKGFFYCRNNKSHTVSYKRNNKENSFFDTLKNRYDSIFNFLNNKQERRKDTYFSLIISCILSKSSPKPRYKPSNKSKYYNSRRWTSNKSK